MSTIELWSVVNDFLNRFTTGSILNHKEASKYWVKDVGPVVESYIGFIETYVDPYGGRAEWEGALLYPQTAGMTRKYHFHLLYSQVSPRL